MKSKILKPLKCSSSRPREGAWIEIITDSIKQSITTSPPRGGVD